MTYNFALPMFPGSNFQMEKSNWTGKLKLFKDGVLLEQLNENGKPFLIPTDNGKMIKAFPKTYHFYQFFLEIAGKRYYITKKYTWYEYVIGFLPIVLAAFGSGFLHSPAYVFMLLFIGLGGSSLNISLILSLEEKSSIKYLKVIGVSVVCFFAYYLIIYGFNK